MDFVLRFSRRYIVPVYIHDVTPDTFQRRGGGRWAYFSPPESMPKDGEFGELHFVKSRLTYDTIAHELAHVVIAYYRLREVSINGRVEEAFCTHLDYLVRQFTRKAKLTRIKIK